MDDYLPHSIKVGAKMMHELAIEFKNQGHNITVITPDFHLTTKSKIDSIDEINIRRFKNPNVKDPLKIKRGINETMLSYNCWKNLKEFFIANPHDLIVYYSPSIFFGFLVSKLKKLWNAKSYLILRDFFPQWVIDQKIIKKNSLIALYFKYFEKINYKSADIIGIQSPKNLEWFNKYTDKKYNLDLLYNWAEDNPVQKGNIYRKKLGLEDKIVFFYGGNIGKAQDMINIVRLAINLKNEPKAHFLLVGSGDEVGLIENATDEYSLKNLTYLPPVSQDEFKKILSEFDIGLFSLHHDHNTHNFPGKLLGYMVQELPILGSINPNNDLKPVVEEFNAGFITTNGEDELLLENALKLIESKELRKKMGQNGKKLLYDKFSVQSAVNQILKIRDEP